MSRGVLAVAAAVSAVGCAGPLKEIRHLAYTPINVADDGKSTLVTVKVYFMKDKGKFDGSKFEDLWEKGKEVLADDYLGEQIFTVSGGKKDDTPKVLQLSTIKEDTNYLGIVANFRKATDRPRHIALDVRADGGAVIEFTEYHVALKR